MASLISCYRRGCGQDYDPQNNEQDVCRHHPGLPYFHDAYKGWTCCAKKTVDFTEFLNIPGCTLGKHSHEKPPELPKSKVDKETAHIPIEVNMKPKAKPFVRPPYNSPMTPLVPVIAEALRKKFSDCPHKMVDHFGTIDDGITIGTKCKRGGCGKSYEGPQSETEECVHHPGVPIFHEGLKYWSCCKKRTSDFSAFLQQVGCSKNLHKWNAEVESSSAVKCRWDWHQTATHVIVAIYAKEYNPNTSSVKVNPIRLIVELEFPNENGAKFYLDMELQGVVNAEQSSAQMFGTKVEIKLTKAEPGSWSKLDIPKSVETEMDEDKSLSSDDDDEDKSEKESDSDLDLSDVEPMPQIGRVNITEVDE